LEKCGTSSATLPTFIEKAEKEKEKEDKRKTYAKPAPVVANLPPDPLEQYINMTDILPVERKTKGSKNFFPYPFSFRFRIPFLVFNVLILFVH